MAGLGQPLASDVEMQWPANLQTAMSLARAYEKRSAEAARAVIPAASRTAPRPRPTAPTTQAPASAPPATERPVLDSLNRLGVDRVDEILTVKEYLAGNRRCHLQWRRHRGRSTLESFEVEAGVMRR